MANMPGAVPLIVFGVGVGLLALEVVFLILVNHGAARRRRIRGRRRSATRSATGQRWKSGVAPSRNVRRDDAYADHRRAAHGLVDRSGLRDVPGDHPQHVGGIRGPGSGACAGAHFRPFAGMASLDHQDLGRQPAASRQVDHRTAPLPSRLANTALALYSQALNTAPKLYSTQSATVGGGTAL